MDSNSPDTPDSLGARVAEVYGQDFVDFVNAINAPYQPRSDTASIPKRQGEA